MGTSMHDLPTSAKLTGIFSLIFVIIGFIIPMAGVLIFIPISVILGIFAIRGGNKTIGLLVIIIVIIKLVISPTFWVNLMAFGHFSEAPMNVLINYINLIGTGLMIYFYVKSPKAVKQAPVEAKPETEAPAGEVKDEE